ncbi:hypothetical protein BT96DRAFT_763798, partial [Gymnopus androsaceus JB14]
KYSRRMASSTSSLEECWAKSLTPEVVSKFYDLLKSIVMKHEIPPKNIYSPDKKGVQLGKGNKTQVLVNRDQKVVQATEHGNCKLVTIIETVCTDGTSLPPSVIFEGSRVN